MFVGTGSDVGKSLIVTGMCRLLKLRGYHPAPFKAQNMSLNSFATPEGLEIGRAQAVQAEAAGIACTTAMNPILLKPSSKHSSQVILHGKPIGDQSAKAYFLGNNKMELFKEATQAFQTLASQYAPVVMEGAGSISELNLKHRDIVNMRMAKAANADVYLVADIDRGGVFASVYGSIALLDDDERALVKGIIINKFRGDISLFETGKKIIEDLTKIPVLGVVPFAPDIYIEDEDSLGLETKNKTTGQNTVNIAVILLPYLSNFTDFNALEMDERVHLFYTRSSDDLEKADIIIIPGSKNTMADLQFLRTTGLAKTIMQASKKGKLLIGICGGYQMLGNSIEDPHGIENEINTLPGLGIIPAKTIMAKEKITVQTSFTFNKISSVCTGYEIHMGHTTFEESSPMNSIDGKPEGYQTATVWGTYIHGLFDNAEIVDTLLAGFTTEQGEKFDYEAYKNENYERLAEHLATHLDIEFIIKEMQRH
jgi:adenosylcobyric acid synthase